MTGPIDSFRLGDRIVKRIGYVPSFPFGGFWRIRSDRLSSIAQAAGATPLTVALAWLLARSPNILPVPGTSSLAHPRDNPSAGEVVLSAAMVEQPGGIAQQP